jgi:hypothetical protein
MLQPSSARLGGAQGVCFYVRIGKIGSRHTQEKQLAQHDFETRRAECSDDTHGKQIIIMQIGRARGPHHHHHRRSHYLHDMEWSRIHKYTLSCG